MVAALSISPVTRPVTHKVAFAARFGPDGPARDAATAGLVALPGGLTAVGRARLDEPDALARALGLSGADGDLELVAAALSRWGPDGLSRVAGEFAVAVCDPHRQTILAARDRFGVVPLYHSRARGGEIAFASTPEAALELSGARAEPDETSVTRFIEGLGPAAHATVYAHVERLPAGCALRLADGTARSDRWFALERPDDADPHTTAHAADAVRETLARSVAARMRGAHRPGVMLSGGLDSSSIAVLAPGGTTPLPTLSLTFDDPALDERRYIRATLDHGRPGGGGFEPTFIPVDGREPADGRDAPSCAYGLETTRHLYAAAAERGIDVVLDGHGGDEVVSHGHGRLVELAREGRYRKLWRETQGLGRTFSQGTLPLFAKLATSHGPLGRALAGPRAVMARARTDGGKPSLLRGDLAAHIARDRANENTRVRGDERDLHLMALTNPALPDAFESLDAAAAGHGVEPRYPFFDPALVRLCLSLPGSAKLADGWTRRPLRDAMSGLLPDAVAWRADKTDFTRHFLSTLKCQTVLDAHDEERLAAFVEVDRLRRLRESVVRAGPRADLASAMQVWRCARLSDWMGRLDDRPVTDGGRA